MEVMTQEKLVPKLRFVDFNNNWTVFSFENVFDRVVTKNKEDNQNVLTISAQKGLVNQKDYFTKYVAAKDLTGYYLLSKGDFAYNKSYSKGYPLGAIKQLTKYDKGVVSTLYICFRIKSPFNDIYFSKYFDSGKINKEIYKIAQEGARNHGLLNMSVIEFFKDIKIVIPDSIEEQQKIASFLSSIDTKIEKLTKKKSLLEDYKKGIMQKLFNQEIRFKDDHENNYPDWEDRKLETVLFEHKAKSTGNEEVFSVSVNKGLINQIEHLGRSFSAANTDNYNLVKPNDIVYTKSPTGDFPYGIIKQSKVLENVIVSPLYGIFTPETEHLGYLLNVYFESYINVHNYLHSIIQKGAKNTINITNTTFLSKSLRLPTNKEEQQKIASFLSSIDKKIDSTTAQLEQTKVFKKGLLQQMFV